MIVGSGVSMLAICSAALVFGALGRRRGADLMTFSFVSGLIGWFGWYFVAAVLSGVLVGVEGDYTDRELKAIASAAAVVVISAIIGIAAWKSRQYVGMYGGSISGGGASGCSLSPFRKRFMRGG